jgi:hypothetical protein
MSIRWYGPWCCCEANCDLICSDTVPSSLMLEFGNTECLVRNTFYNFFPPPSPCYYDSNVDGSWELPLVRCAETSFNHPTGCAPLNTSTGGGCFPWPGANPVGFFCNSCPELLYGNIPLEHPDNPKPPINYLATGSCLVPQTVPFPSTLELEWEWWVTVIMRHTAAPITGLHFEVRLYRDWRWFNVASPTIIGNSGRNRVAWCAHLEDGHLCADREIDFGSACGVESTATVGGGLGMTACRTTTIPTCLLTL